MAAINYVRPGHSAAFAPILWQFVLHFGIGVDIFWFGIWLVILFGIWMILNGYALIWWWLLICWGLWARLLIRELNLRDGKLAIG